MAGLALPASMGSMQWTVEADSRWRRRAWHGCQVLASVSALLAAWALLFAASRGAHAHAGASARTRNLAQQHRRETMAQQQRRERVQAAELLAEEAAMGLEEVKAKVACYDARPGQQCYKDVMQAKRHDIEHHPDWFVGLCKESTFKDIQAFFHKQRGNDGKTRCPKPCGGTESNVCFKTKEKSKGGDSCHDVLKGEECYNHVLYTMKSLAKGIKKKHPDWYPGLSADASFIEVQNFLHAQKEVCPKPCVETPDRAEEDHDDAVEEDDTKQEHNGKKEVSSFRVSQNESRKHEKEKEPEPERKTTAEPQQETTETETEPPEPEEEDEAESKPDEEDCFTAQPGDGGCYDHVMWVKNRIKDGFKNAMCKGLAQDSSIVDIQSCLYRDPSSRCKSPPCSKCPPPRHGCSGEKFVYQTLDCDGDGVSDHLCTTTADNDMWLVLSSEGCPRSWGSKRRRSSECQAAPADIVVA